MLGLGSLYGTTTSATLRNVPASQAGIASGISYTAFLLGSELGLADVAVVLQNRLVAGLEGPAAAAGLPASVAGDVGGALAGGLAGGNAATAARGFPPELVDAFTTAFTDAVSATLLVCAAVAVAGAPSSPSCSPTPAAAHGC